MTLRRAVPIMAGPLAAAVWSAGLIVEADSSRGQNGDDSRKWLNVIADINRSGVSFVVHDGDFKSGSSLCSDDDVSAPLRRVLDNFRIRDFEVLADVSAVTRAPIEASV